MEFETIGKNRIKVTVSASEQAEFGVCYETMDHSDRNTRRLCEEIMKRADSEIGFRPDRGKILVEARKCRDGKVALYLSRIDIENGNFCGTVKFSNADGVIDAIKIISRFSVVCPTCRLYFYKNEYYITFEISANRKSADAFRFSLLEYGEKSGKSREFLSEYAEHISDLS